MKLLFAFVLIGALAVGSYATSVSVTTKAFAADSGILVNVYFESATASGSTTPSVVTATTQPGTTGSTTISRGSTDYLYSPQFISARNVAAGAWVVDLWALAAKSGAMTVSIAIVNSAGSVQTTVASGTTPTITTTKGQGALRLSGSAVSVPAMGYIRVSFTAPTGTANPSSFTLYWGKAQGTNFQVPMSIESS
jgi:hypothetical protein